MTNTDTSIKTSNPTAAERPERALSGLGPLVVSPRNPRYFTHRGDRRRSAPST